MVDSKRYDPTITRFQKHTQSFVSGKTKKGHLNKDNDERESGDVIKEEGILVKVNSKDLHGKTWEVKVDKKTYMCSYGDNIIYLPPYTVNGTYYIPKKECKVEVSIDKKSKIYTITRILDSDKQPITMSNNHITIQTSGDASVKVEKNKTSISSGKASVKVEDNKTSVSGEKLSVEGDVEVKTSKDNDLPDKISITDLYKKVQNIEIKLSDKNDSGK